MNAARSGLSRRPRPAALIRVLSPAAGANARGPPGRAPPARAAWGWRGRVTGTRPCIRQEGPTETSEGRGPLGGRAGGRLRAPAAGGPRSGEDRFACESLPPTRARLARHSHPTWHPAAFNPFAFPGGEEVAPRRHCRQQLRSRPSSWSHQTHLRLRLRLAAGGGASRAPAPGRGTRGEPCTWAPVTPLRLLARPPPPPAPTRLCKGLLYLETFTEPFWIVLALIGF